MTTRARGPGV